MRTLVPPAVAPDELVIVGTPLIGPRAGQSLAVVANRQDLMQCIDDWRYLTRVGRRAMRKSIAAEVRRALLISELTEIQRTDFAGDLSLLWAFDWAFGPKELTSAGLVSIGVIFDAHEHSPWDGRGSCVVKLTPAAGTGDEDWHEH